jgi:hypothetical protein
VGLHTFALNEHLLQAGSSGEPPLSISKTLAFPKSGAMGAAVAIQVRITEIDWESVRMVSIEGHQLEVVTEHGAYDFQFPNTEKLSEALLILALQSTKRVEFVDDRRFNPVNFCR